MVFGSFKQEIRLSCCKFENWTIYVLFMLIFRAKKSSCDISIFFATVYPALCQSTSEGVKVQNCLDNAVSARCGKLVKSMYSLSTTDKSTKLHKHCRLCQMELPYHMHINNCLFKNAPTPGQTIFILQYLISFMEYFSIPITV